MSRPRDNGFEESDDVSIKLASDPTRNSIQKSRWSRYIRRADRIWSDTWFLETIALALTISCSIGLCATLGSLDHRPLPPMPKTLTLNTIISFLASIAKSSLILIVSSCIGQLKWKWYQQRRPVKDIQLFDDASRGPLGSFQMLVEHRGMSMACLGALILLLALLFDSFVQQAVAYPSLVVLSPSSSAKAKQSRVFLAGLQADYGMPSIAQEALNSGIWSSGFAPKPYCPSSDCTWDTFTSLGLCSSCGPSDPPPQLECNFNTSYPQSYVQANSYSFDNKSCNISFRNGRVSQQLDIDFQFWNTDSSDNGEFRVVGPAYGLFDIYAGGYVGGGHRVFDLINDTIQGVSNPLLALAAVHFNLTDTSLTIAKAEECTLNYCLRDYTLKTTNNTPQIVVSNIRNGAGTRMPIYKGGPEYWCWLAENKTFSMDIPSLHKNIADGSYLCWDNQETAGSPQSCGYGGSYVFDPEHFSFCTTKVYGWFLNWGGTITDYLVGTISQFVTIGCSGDPGDDWRSCEAVGDGHLMDASSAAATPGPNGSVTDAILHTYLIGIDAVMPNIADSMTLLNLEHNSTDIEGQAGGLVTHVQVRWAWLALPTILLGAGVFLFLYTIYETQRHGIRLWKNSALAVLYHGLETEELDRTVDVEVVSAMELKAAKLRVQIRSVGQAHGRTVLRRAP